MSSQYVCSRVVRDGQRDVLEVTVEFGQNKAEIAEMNDYKSKVRGMNFVAVRSCNFDTVRSCNFDTCDARRPR
jgi:hypothetical protein